MIISLVKKEGRLWAGRKARIYHRLPSVLLRFHLLPSFRHLRGRGSCRLFFLLHQPERIGSHGSESRVYCPFS